MTITIIIVFNAAYHACRLHFLSCEVNVSADESATDKKALDSISLRHVICVRVRHSLVNVRQPSANSMRSTLKLFIYNSIMAYFVHYTIRMEVATCHINMTDTLAPHISIGTGEE